MATQVDDGALDDVENLYTLLNVERCVNGIPSFQASTHLHLLVFYRLLFRWLRGDTPLKNGDKGGRCGDPDGPSSRASSSPVISSIDGPTIKQHKVLILQSPPISYNPRLNPEVVRMLLPWKGLQFLSDPSLVHGYRQ